ncbi:hypothetical protein KFL_002660045 [Klebsormidium nitens]|uniref:Uncharacterized protein n=1 Tax=Klebsormidium nitens TaxID=105231 RepID=A0A1Y1I4Z5_KLENI|nr:hypothetical protein KFL_002660045 [Klebsormidium nitens]|eukprot:GAQ86024.1 hypothetical protein KFL_002660045 [Klebsormidium nitens]
MDFVDAPITRLSSLRSLKTVPSLSRAEYRSGREATPSQQEPDQNGDVEVVYDSQKVAELLKATPTKRGDSSSTAQNTPRQVLHKLKSGDHGSADRDIVENLKKQVLILEKKLQDQELNGTLAEGTSARLQLNEFKASVQNGLKTGLLELEQRYEASHRILEGMAECLTEELTRMQDHVMLMQEQIDTQKSMLQKVIPDMQKKMDHEKTSYSLVQKSMRDSKQQLQEAIAQQNKSNQDLRDRIEMLEKEQHENSLNLFGIFLQETLCCCFVSRRRYKSPIWDRD